MNRAHQIRRMAKRIAEYGIEDLSTFDVETLKHLIDAEHGERWRNELRPGPAMKPLGVPR